MIDLPKDFEKRMISQLGDEFPAFLESYSDGKVSALRLNPLKFKAAGGNGTEHGPSVGTDERTGHASAPTDNRFQIDKDLLFACDMVPWCEMGFYYNEALRPGSHPYHEAGLYYIQDASAMLPAELLSPAPGEKVLDLCAAPGGKTTQLGAKMSGSGILVANEIIPSRARILSENVERMGIRNCIVTCESPDRLSEKFSGYFDRILVDAPCSGEGMFRKNPEAMNEWSLKNVRMCADRQDLILSEAAKMLAPGGVIVYSTCTFSPEENEGAIDRFLASHPDFMSTISRRLWPHKVRGEGHFAARLEWEDETSETENAPVQTVQKKPLKEKNFLAFAESFLNPEFTGSLTGDTLLFGDQLYLLPPNAPDLSGIKVLRPGLHLGTIKKNRFEPAHALALAMTPKDAAQSIDFPSDGREIREYLSGNMILVSDTASQSSISGAKKDGGWTLVCVDGYSIGWGKLVGDQLKNHYPKGLRKVLQ